MCIVKYSPSAFHALVKQSSPQLPQNQRFIASKKPVLYLCVDMVIYCFRKRVGLYF